MQHTSLAKEKINILLLEGVHQNATDCLIKDGYSSIKNLSTSLPTEQLVKEISGVHFLGIRSRTQVNAEVIAAADKLTAIGCFCIGTNQVDLTVTQRHGIPVFNAPFANTRSVAELVLAETILLLRGIPEKNALAHRGGWLKSAKQSYEARNKTLGIVGYGHIGTQLGILAENLGMHVIYYDIENKLTLGNAKPVASLAELLQQSDAVSLHVPATAETQNMIDAEQLALMKADSVLVNASRGNVVDINALASALTNKQIAGAAIDVFPEEPKSNTDEFISPLRDLDNVILTPHVGGSTQEAQAQIGIEVTEKLIKYSNNGSTMSAVNFPQVALPEHSGKHRLLHIHHNTPGVLNQLNEILAQNNINISAQYLQTNQDIGYVVTDIDQHSSQLALEKLQQISGTIRARILY